MKDLFFQIVKFGFVGVVAAIVDVGILMFLSEIVHLDVMISSAVSFCVSVTVNYILSMHFVFKSDGQNKLKEFILFVVMSIGGLGINQLIMWIGINLLSLYYLFVKIMAMVFVPVYNFVTRKIFLE